MKKLAAGITTALLLAVVYNRGEWGSWRDDDRDCLNTRHEVLLSRSVVAPEVLDCKVISGQWLDYYTGDIRTNPSELDIDHVVPVAHAHSVGTWDKAKRKKFYNDIHNLVITHRSINRSKGARTPATWQPLLGRCRYAHQWLRVKDKYDLLISVDEFWALGRALKECV